MVQAKSISDQDLMQLSSMNPELRFERNADGSLVTMPPTGGISGNREAKAITRLSLWAESQNAGECFSSSTGFKLPNGAVRSPDAAFIAKDRLANDWDQGEDEFVTVLPDFVIEIRSKSDSLSDLQDKMQEYIENGVRLAWLIDRQNQQAFAYRADGTITQYPKTATLDGETVAPGFQLKLTDFI